jgi:hypothetical protein
MDRYFDNLENVKRHCEKIYSSVMFDKVAKKKALILDMDDGLEINPDRGNKKISD